MCWDLGAGTCSNSECSCPCTSGLFAGWDTWLIFMAVFVNTAQGAGLRALASNFNCFHVLSTVFIRFPGFFMCFPIAFYGILI